METHTNIEGRQANFYTKPIPNDELPIHGKQPKYVGRVLEATKTDKTWNGIPAWEYKIQGQSGAIKTVGMDQYTKEIEEEGKRMTWKEYLKYIKEMCNDWTKDTVVLQKPEKRKQRQGELF